MPTQASTPSISTSLHSEACTSSAATTEIISADVARLAKLYRWIHNNAGNWESSKAQVRCWLMA